MRFYIILIFLLVTSCSCISQVHVNGYYRNDGTYVESHYRSNPDGNPYNNWSYPGNVNPYTGKIATGNESIYLSNYYNVFPNSETSSTNFSNYTVCLVYTNYKGMKERESYTFGNKTGTMTGFAQYYQNDLHKVFDRNYIHIGYVKTSKNGKRYFVYDLKGYEVSNNKKTINWKRVSNFIIVGGIVYLIFGVLS